MVAAVLCFAIAIIGIVVIIETASSNNPRTRSKTRRGSAIQRYKKESSIETKSEGEKRCRAELRLSAYLFFDAKQAARLVDGVQARFPDKPRKWCAEKALADLERDRQVR